MHTKYITGIEGTKLSCPEILPARANLMPRGSARGGNISKIICPGVSYLIYSLTEANSTCIRKNRIRKAAEFAGVKNPMKHLIAGSRFQQAT